MVKLNYRKPVLSGHRIKRTSSIERTVAEVPKFIFLIYFLYLITPKKYLKLSFLSLPTSIKRTLVIKFHHPHARHRKCETLPRIATHKFFDFYIKKRDLTNLFDHFLSTVLFSISFCLYRACFTHLISSNLSCNLCLRYYDHLVHFDI